MAEGTWVLARAGAAAGIACTVAVGVVDRLWRYAVKSMCPRMTELTVAPRAVVGDRAWALRDAMGVLHAPVE